MKPLSNLDTAPTKHLIRAIRTFWDEKKDDLEYCNKTFDHLQRVIDMCIAVCGRATGL